MKSKNVRAPGVVIGNSSPSKETSAGTQVHIELKMHACGKSVGDKDRDKQCVLDIQLRPRSVDGNIEDERS